jgi:hypothetical protein
LEQPPSLQASMWFHIFIAMWTGFSKTRRQFHFTRFVTFTSIAMSRTEKSFTITEFYLSYERTLKW